MKASRTLMIALSHQSRCCGRRTLTTLRPIASIGRPVRYPQVAVPRYVRWQSAAAAQQEEASVDTEKYIIPQEEIRKKLPPADKQRLSRLRNIGISAHIDSGKTTFTERVLFYTGRIKAIHEVRGKDNVGATMDFMDLEREKGITIQSAATFCDWEKRDPETGKTDKCSINIIDTPGHIDFTIEVERALRVLDGAVLVLCAVSGVQSQTITVDRQMRRYNVPRISFVNKMDRTGANPWKAIDGINQKLRMAAAAVQVPIGEESDFKGVVDLIRMKALYNEGERGVIIREAEIPADVLELAKEKRRILIETLADVDDVIADKYLMEEEPTVQELQDAIRRATIALKFSPVLMGSALGDTAVQHVLDAVSQYLPDPSEKANRALDRTRDEAPVSLVPYSKEPLVGLAFKLEEGRYGQLTYIRVYQGKLKKGTYIENVRTEKKVKVARLVRMHSNEMEDIEEAGSGEICAVFGIDCASGDTFTDGTLEYTMSSMFVPEPVISLALKPLHKETANFSRALNRFQREDPTFRVHLDTESKETIISGMGELHLDIYVERMKREYGVECSVGKPQVRYRETIRQRMPFNYTHKKQSGGAGQYAKVIGYIEPMPGNENGGPSEFINNIVGGRISENYIPACQKGFEDGLVHGFIIDQPVVGVRYVLEDGQMHHVDSSEIAFRLASVYSFKEAFEKARPVILEPVMTVQVTAPVEFQGAIIGGLNKRRAIIHDTEIGHDEFTVSCDVTLNEMFGYSTELRASTQGKGEFSMEFKNYQFCFEQDQKVLVEAFKKKQAERAAAGLGGGVSLARI